MNKKTSTVVYFSKMAAQIAQTVIFMFSNVAYRHSSIYAVNVGTHKKAAESKNRINRGYLVVLKGRKMG